MKDSLIKAISTHELGHRTEELMDAARNAICIHKRKSDADHLGGSRVGGLPDLPRRLVWPTHEGRSLDFLAQINCSELATQALEAALPSTGMLYFFYDNEKQPSACGPGHKSTAAVIYAPESPLERAGLPDDLDPDFVFPPIPIRFASFLSMPSLRSGAFKRLGLDRDEKRAYKRMFKALYGFGFGDNDVSKHQLLGYPEIIQDDEMEHTCQRLSQGFAGESPRSDGQSSDWRLLLQFDSDFDLDVSWGDSGMLYFWIRDGDLRHCDFSHTWTMLQCY